jgi:hypothetical protein
VQRLHNPHLKIAAALFSSLIAGFVVFTSAAQNPTARGVESIHAEELRQKLTYIASEKFKGRGNGTPELDSSAEYIAGIFEKNGLKPAGGDGTYYQHFEIYSSRIGANNDLRINSGSDPGLDLKVRSDFIPELWSVSGSVKAPLELLEDNRTNIPNLKG